MLNFLYAEIESILDTPKQTVKLPHGIREITKPAFKIDEFRGVGVNVTAYIKVQVKDTDLSIVNNSIDNVLIKLMGKFIQQLNTNIQFTQGAIIQGTDGYTGLLEFTIEYSPRRDLALPEPTIELESLSLTFNQNCP